MVFVRVIIKQLCRVYKLGYRYCYCCIEAPSLEEEEKFFKPMQDEMVSTNFPQIPPRLESLYDNESNSDIEFVVGPDWDQWRFPAHQSVMRNNPVFQAMLEGPLATDEKSITIRDVDGRAFDLLLRHIYGQKVEFRTYDHALATIYAANKYLCPELVKCCVIYLDKEINDETVMSVYRQLRLFASTFGEISPDNPFAFSSAPPTESDTNGVPVDDQRERSGEMMTSYCTSLLYNCFHYVDSNAEGLLKSDALEDLDHDQLLDIVKRDRLRIGSELILFDALMRWCIQQCKRRQLELTVENRRIVLSNDLIFSVRYLLMSSEEFMSGPALSGIIHPTDVSILLAKIEGVPADPNITSPQLSDTTLNILAKPRNTEIYSPFPLSERSKKIITKDLKDEVSKKKKKDKKRAKDAKNKRNSRHEEDEEERESRCFNYTLNILSTIFD